VPDNYYRVENRDHDADDLTAGGSADSISGHRKRIEPWLSAIFQSEHLNLLLGSGFSAGLARAANADAASMAQVSIDPAFDVNINEAAVRSARAMGRGAANVEDQFRCAIALNDGLSVQGDGRQSQFATNLKRALAAFGNSIISMEGNIAAAGLLDDADEERFEALLMDFLLSFSSRTASRDRLHVFTTNYDRLIEHGFDLLGVRPLDRFVGSLSPRFRASRFDVDIHYSPPGGRGEARPLEGVVRLTKLHGSVDWAFSGGDVVRRAIPFGGPHTISAEQAFGMMIFPNSGKDIETAFFPYAELFRDFSAAACRPNSALVTYGYGFGDDHVNRVIRDMLTLPSTHLVIISFDDAGGRIPRFVERSGRAAQISQVIGPRLAALDQLVPHYLPKPAIDTITQRQAQLLDRRGRLRDDQGPEGGTLT
jgi:hypothetical protein